MSLTTTQAQLLEHVYNPDYLNKEGYYYCECSALSGGKPWRVATVTSLMKLGLIDIGVDHPNESKGHNLDTYGMPHLHPHGSPWDANGVYFLCNPRGARATKTSEAYMKRIPKPWADGLKKWHKDTRGARTDYTETTTTLIQLAMDRGYLKGDADHVNKDEARSEGYSFPEEDEHIVFHEEGEGAFAERYQHGQLGRI
jgi:hypothetical protein